ncbi:MAG TPA: hypothetical protein VK886_06890 [Vicinamibacterales bacterium]|nr:hypothetical protein [Vicinamibacterales bacterium]
MKSPYSGSESFVATSAAPDLPGSMPGGNGHLEISSQGAPEPPSDLSLNWEDLKMLAGVDRTRRESTLVRNWWNEREAAGEFAERLDIVREIQPRERAYGFFDTATIDNQALPVMGLVQQMFYDRPKKTSPEDVRDQVREFVLGFFMRVSHYERPGAAAPSQPTLPWFMRPLSWIPESEDGRVGFGYEQLMYKLRETGQVGKFGPHERGAIVDLRSLGSVYDWVAMRVNLFDFYIAMSPFGADFLKMELPLKEITYLLVTPDLIVDRHNPSADVLGEYGFGYGLLPYSPDPSIFAYGPGRFGAGFQSFAFQVLRNGEIRAKAVFVVNRPDKILSIDVDPIDWGFRVADLMTLNLASTVMAPFKAIAKQLPLRLSNVDPISLYISTANLVSGGLAERRLGISKTQLEKHMLLRHFLQHRQMLITSLLVWRMVADWTDVKALPDFCHRGFSGQPE